MPLFDPETVRTLVGDRADGEYTLDLCGVSREQAQLAISGMLEQQADGADTVSVVVRIDPATPTSGETLFLPVGRQLLEARRQGLIRRFHPLPEANGGGFYVELPGRQQSLAGDS